MLLDVGYTGNRAHHLGTSDAWDSLPVQYLSQSPFRDNCDHQRTGAQVPNPFANIPAFATTSLG